MLAKPRLSAASTMRRSKRCESRPTGTWNASPPSTATSMKSRRVLYLRRNERVKRAADKSAQRAANDGDGCGAREMVVRKRSTGVVRPGACSA